MSLGVRSRKGAQRNCRACTRTFVGDAVLTDDPHDDWFCVAFVDAWVDDWYPSSLYIHKRTGAVKTLRAGWWVRLLQGLLLDRVLRQHALAPHHARLLNALIADCLAASSRGAATAPNVPLGAHVPMHLQRA